MDKVVTELINPVIGRIGTFVAGALVSYGVAVEHANAIGLGVVACVFVGVDLVMRRLVKK